jgi:hypothetical protein
LTIRKPLIHAANQRATIRGHRLLLYRSFGDLLSISDTAGSDGASATQSWIDRPITKGLAHSLAAGGLIRSRGIHDVYWSIR